MKKYALLIFLILFIISKGITQEYHKIKISKSKVKLIQEDNSKEVFEIDSIQNRPAGKIFYLSGAEKNITMEFFKKEQIVRLQLAKSSSYFEPIDDIRIDAIAINVQKLE